MPSMGWLFSWGVTSVIVVAFASLGQGFVALKDFKLAKLFFLLAAADAAGGIVMWGIKTDVSPLVRILTVFVGMGLVGVLAMQSIRYVDRKKVEKENPPDISGEFVFEAAAPTGEKKENCLATLVVHIKNLGAPTALEHISIVVARDTKIFNAQFVPPRNIILFTGANATGPEVQFSAENHLVQKAARNPILMNVPIDTWFQIVVYGLTRDEFFSKGTKVSLNFDVTATGKKGSITYLSKGGPPESPMDVKKLFRETR
jgi:hypothetical protein